jgi:hypothetical protein
MQIGVAMDTKERKQRVPKNPAEQKRLALQKLDTMYSKLDPDTLLVDTSQIRRLEATLTDTFNRAIASGVIDSSTAATIKVVLNMIPLIICVAVLLVVVAMLGPGADE